MINDLPAVLMIAQALQKQMKRIESKPCHWITLRDSLCSSSPLIDQSIKLQLIFGLTILEVVLQLSNTKLLVLKIVLSTLPNYRTLFYGICTQAEEIKLL